MADLNVALILRLVDKATGPAKAVIDRVNRMSGGAFAKSARLVNRGAREMGGGLADAARHARGGVAAIAAYQGALVGIGAAFLKPAAEMERYNVQLQNLEGSAEGAKKAMAWIRDFATRTPLELNDTVAAYAKLKAFGVDPMNGSLQAMVDTMAATGGGAEQLDGLVLALGQAWTKGKLQGEEALQMLERGVPVWDLLGKKMGKNAAELQDMASKGKLGRKEITLLIEALAERNKGASDKMSKTWGGIISNLSDQWTAFQMLVMDAGVFDFLKGRLQQLMAFLNAAAADGRLKKWADTLSSAIIAALERTWQLGEQLYEVWQQAWPVLQQAAEWAGGWRNLMIAIMGLTFARNILGIAMAFMRLGRGIVLVTRATAVLGRGMLVLSRGVLTRLGSAAIAIATRALPLATRGFGLLRAAMLAAGRAAMLNPIGATIAAIAGAVYVIYRNWDNIVAYFSGKIDGIRSAFDKGLINGVFAILTEMNPFVVILDGAKGLFEYVTGWDWNADVVAPIVRAVMSIDLVQAGVKIIADILAGLAAKLGELLAWFQELPGRIMAAIGSIDLSSLIHWPQPPEWLRRLWNGEGAVSAPAPAQAGGASGSWDAPAPADVSGARALGGPVRAGQIYRWQEEGREYFMPRTDGTVMSNRQLRRAADRQDGAPGIRGSHWSDLVDRTRRWRNGPLSASPAGSANVSVSGVPASRMERPIIADRRLISAAPARQRLGGTMTVGDITINAAPGQSAEDIARAVRRELTRLAGQTRTLLHDGGAYA